MWAGGSSFRKASSVEMEEWTSPLYSERTARLVMAAGRRVGEEEEEGRRREETMEAGEEEEEGGGGWEEEEEEVSWKMNCALYKCRSGESLSSSHPPTHPKREGKTTAPTHNHPQPPIYIHRGWVVGWVGTHSVFLVLSFPATPSNRAAASTHLPSASASNPLPIPTPASTHPQ